MSGHILYTCCILNNCLNHKQVFFLCFALFFFPNQLPLWGESDGGVRSDESFDTYYHANTLGLFLFS